MSKPTLQEAFRRLAELAGSRWDGVDAQEYVNQIRSALPLSCDPLGDGPICPRFPKCQCGESLKFERVKCDPPCALYQAGSCMCAFSERRSGGQS